MSRKTEPIGDANAQSQVARKTTASVFRGIRNAAKNVAVQIVRISNSDFTSNKLIYFKVVMLRVEEELVGSMHRSIQQIINMFKLVKANPPELKAKTVIQYSLLIQEMLLEFYNLIPKTCVPKKLFKGLQNQNMELSQLAQNYMREHRKGLIEMKVLEDKLKESQEREKKLIEEKNHLMKNSQQLKKKAQILKKSGEQTVKNILEINSQKEVRSHRQSLPQLDKLDKKEKISLLYMMGPSNQNDRLVQHLMSKR